MAYTYYKFNGSIDRRKARNEGDLSDVVVLENLLSRDGKLSKIKGTEKVNSASISGTINWAGRYNTNETGKTPFKTFCYTNEGIMYVVDELAGTINAIKEGLNNDSYPKHWLFKTNTVVNMFLADGKDLWKFDGNNENKWVNLNLTDGNGDSINPIDVIEHRDRLCLISKTNLYISKNLEPEVFDDATDSLNIIVGSGKGQNLALIKHEDALFIFNTEGIYILYGDTISAVASTFEVKLVDEIKAIAPRSIVKTGIGILFLADDYELWSFNGNNAKLLSYNFKLIDFVNPKKVFLDKAVAHYSYHNKYYMLSLVETGKTKNNIEIFYDIVENKINFIRDRNVSCYMETDVTEEEHYMLLGRSDAGHLMWTDRGSNFDEEAVKVKLRTKDITIEKGMNVRFLKFFPEIEPSGEREMFFRYLLDGRLSDLDEAASWQQALDGEAKLLGLIRIVNQAQFIDRVSPKINYSKGTSICFELYDATKDLNFTLLGIGIKYIFKGLKKGKKVGQ